MVATQTTTSNSTVEQQGAGGPRNVVPDLSEVFADRGAARGVHPNASDRFSVLCRGAVYLPGV